MKHVNCKKTALANLDEKLKLSNIEQIKKTKRSILSKSASKTEKRELFLHYVIIKDFKAIKVKFGCHYKKVALLILIASNGRLS